MVKHFLVQTLAFVHEVCRHRPAEDFRTVLQYLNSSTTGEVGARGGGKESVYTTWGNVNLGSYYGNQDGGSSKYLKIEIAS